MHVLIAVASLHGSVDPHAKAPSIPVMGVPVMNGLTLLDQLVTSIDHPVHKLVLVHNLDDGQPNAEVCAWTARMRKSPPNHVKQVSVVTYRENLGCAAAWNTIMLQNQQSPWWLIVNADVSFRPGTLRTIASHVWAGLLASTPGGRDPVCNWLFHGWSAFALANRALHRVGTFDENFWPAYSEDCDYQARLEDPSHKHTCPTIPLISRVKYTSGGGSGHARAALRRGRFCIRVRWLLLLFRRGLSAPVAGQTAPSVRSTRIGTLAGSTPC